MRIWLNSGGSVCLNEEFDKLHQKWQEKADRAYNMYRSMDIHFCKSTGQVLGKLRDDKDVPVLSDALFHGVDILITGDKDFLEAGIDHPIILSPAMFLEFMYNGEI